MTITLTFHVKGLQSAEEGHEFAASLVEHVLETFNDDESIDSSVDVVVNANAVKGGH